MFYYSRIRSVRWTGSERFCGREATPGTGSPRVSAVL